MTTDIFLKELYSLSGVNKKIILYPYYTDREKLYNRFVKKVIVNDLLIELITKGWLGDIYKWTNGIDLSNYYIAPFNNYFNKKELPMNDFYLDWRSSRGNNPNEIMNFIAFMTNGKKLVGCLKNLTDTKGNNFIGIAQGKRIVNDVLIISSSIFNFYDEIIRQLKETGEIVLSEDIDYWKSVDPELKMFYDKKLIREYKMRYMLDNDSNKYKEYSEDENMQ